MASASLTFFLLLSTYGNHSSFIIQTGLLVLEQTTTIISSKDGDDQVRRVNKQQQQRRFMFFFSLRKGNDVFRACSEPESQQGCMHNEGTSMKNHAYPSFFLVYFMRSSASRSLPRQITGSIPCRSNMFPADLVTGDPSPAVYFFYFHCDIIQLVLIFKTL